jgi:hypothetical protein
MVTWACGFNAAIWAVQTLASQRRPGIRITSKARASRAEFVERKAGLSLGVTQFLLAITFIPHV